MTDAVSQRTCHLCGAPMRPGIRSSGGFQYFHCDACRRTETSYYEDMLASSRTRPKTERESVDAGRARREARVAARERARAARLEDWRRRASSWFDYLDSSADGQAPPRRRQRPRPKPPAPAAEAGPPCPWRTLELTPGTPLEHARVRFRALARVHHPDRPGGDADQMRIIIEAFREIQRYHDEGAEAGSEAGQNPPPASAAQASGHWSQSSRGQR